MAAGQDDKIKGRKTLAGLLLFLTYKGSITPIFSPNAHLCGVRACNKQYYCIYSDDA